MDAATVRLTFDRDTLVLNGPPAILSALPGCRLDPRVGQYRAEARCYRAIDECHHLPGPRYLLAAVGSLAPFRLGLTATPERADGQEALLPELIGPIVFRREITELVGGILADYRTERLYVELTPEEQQR